MVARIVGEIAEREFDYPESFEDTAVKRYIVRTTKPTDDINVVAACPGLPRRGFLHPRRFDMWCINIRGRQMDAWYKWIVECEYKLIPANQRNQNGQGDQEKRNDPIKREPVITGRFGEYQYVEQAGSLANYAGTPVERGAAGAAEFSSSAGELFDPLPELTGYFVLTSIKKNEPKRQVKLWTKFAGAVNTDIVSGYKPGQVACLGISWGQEQWENETKFVEVTYDLGVKLGEDPWQLSLLDHGTYYLEFGKKVPFKDSEGNARLGLLDGEGGELAPGGSPVYRKFVVRSKQSFAALRLPNFN